MRRLVSWASIPTIAVGLFLALAGVAGAQSAASPGQGSGAECPSKNGCLRAIAVDGFIDEINEDFIRTAVEDAEATTGTIAVVLIVDSPGSVIDDDRLEALVTRLRESSVTVTAWIGPSGSHALGGAAELVAALPSSMAPNTEIGDVGTPRLRSGAYDDLATTTTPGLRSGVFDEKQAVKAGIVQRVDPTIGDHVLEIPGVPSREVKDDEGRPKREITALRTTQKIPITTQLLHNAASPAVAYLALGIAIGLLLFEFFTAGIGVAGVTGAIAAVMAAYGLGALPLRPWALGLCLFSAFAFAIDIQTAIPRAWTVIGLVCWSVGSVFLFDGFRAPWLALATGIGGMAITMLSGMPSMVRSRFATPTLGRDWMIGKEGVALTDVDPEGTVEIGGGQWRALTNRATPVLAGAPVRVVSIDGLTLEIEPPEGGAVDYREKRSSRREGAADS